MSDTQKDLQSQVQAIAERINNGITYEDAGIDHKEHDAEPTAIISGWDYLEDALDIEYRVGSDMSYKGAEVLVTFGGPNIWIDTKHKCVRGAWWGDSAVAHYTDDAMGIDDALEELYESGR